MSFNNDVANFKKLKNLLKYDLETLALKKVNDLF